MTEAVVETGQTDKWQRLSPFSVLHFIIKSIYQFATQGIQGLLPILAVFASSGDKRWFVLGLIALAAGVLLLVGAILSYMKFRYRVVGGQVHIQSGVMKRKRLHLDFNRIQNVALEEPIYFRPFKLVSLKIEGAGSSGEEVNLAGIKRAEAEEIRQLVLLGCSEPQMEENEESDLDAQKEVLSETIIELPVSELVRYGLSNNNIWVMAGILGGIIPQLKPWEWGLFDIIGTWVESNFGDIPFGYPLFFTGLFLTVLLLIIGMSVAGAIIGQYNYHLSRSNDGRFHRTKGLFERQETSMLERKVQSLFFRQSWMAKLVNRWHVYLRQVSFGRGGAQGQPGKKGGTNSLMVPSATEDFLAEISAILYPGTNVIHQPLNPINRRFIYKTLGYYFLPVGIIVATFITYNSQSIYGLLPLLLPVVMAPFVYLRWRRYGYCCDNQYGLVRGGLFGQRKTLFPFYKVQGVEVRQSYGQRRSGHARLRIKLAGNRISIPYMPLKDAYAWRDRILYEIETTKGGFM